MTTSQTHLLKNAIVLTWSTKRMVRIVVRNGQLMLTLEQKKGDRIRAEVSGNDIVFLDGASSFRKEIHL